MESCTSLKVANEYINVYLTNNFTKRIMVTSSVFYFIGKVYSLHHHDIVL